MNVFGTLGKLAIGFAAAKVVDIVIRNQGGEGILNTAQIAPGSALAGSGQGLAQMQAMLNQIQSGEALTQMKGLVDDYAAKNGMDLDAMRANVAAGKRPGLLSQLAENGGDRAQALAALSGAAQTLKASNGGLGALLDSFNQPAAPAPDEEANAVLLLRAMLQAAKADGAIDDAEKAAILDSAGEDADEEDIALIKAELEKPVDVEALAAETPEDLRPKLYSASLMAIRVDTPAEAQYLDQLASALGLGQDDVNALHEKLGVAPLYGG